MTVYKTGPFLPVTQELFDDAAAWERSILAETGMAPRLVEYWMRRGGSMAWVAWRMSRPDSVQRVRDRIERLANEVR